MDTDFNIQQYNIKDIFDNIDNFKENDNVLINQVSVDNISKNNLNTLNQVNNDIKKHFIKCFNKIFKLVNKFNDDNILSRHLLETQIQALIQNLFIYSEPFWEETSLLKDIFSYKFTKRSFPSYAEFAPNLKKIIQNIETEQTNNKTIKSQETPVEQNKDKIIEELEKLETQVLKKQNVYKKNLYGNKKNIMHILNTNFIDESTLDSVNESNAHAAYKTLSINNYFDYVKQDFIENLFTVCYEKKLYTAMLSLYSSICCSKELCHFAFNNVIVDLMFNPYKYEYNYATKSSNNPFLETKTLEIIHYSLFYAFYIMYKEECYVKAYANLQHRHVLDVETFSKIPNYTGNINNNPFIPLTLSGFYLNNNHVNKNKFIVKPIKSDMDKGFYSVHSFWKRFEIFTDGIFNGINTNKIYFGGSVISACLIKNPLEEMFYKPLHKEQDLIYNDKQYNFNNENNQVYTEYLSQVKNLHNYWERNKNKLNSYFDEYYPSKNVINNKKFNTENVDFDLYKFLDLEDVLSDIDIKVDVIDDANFDYITKNIYSTIKKNLLIKHDLNKLGNYQLQLVKVETKKSYKYYISGTLIKRSIEIFRLYGAHPIGGVARYHFPCVRGVAMPNSEINQSLFGKVYALPSLCSYANTGLLIDYKWMVEGTNSIELVLKYFVRGSPLLMNEKEHILLYDHIVKNREVWEPLLQYSNNDITISVNNPIFKPKKLLYGVYKKILKYVNESDIVNNYNYNYYMETIKYNLHYEDIVCDSVCDVSQTDVSQTESQTDEEKVVDKQKVYNKIVLNTRYPSGHINPIYAWQIIAYVSYLKRDKKY